VERQRVEQASPLFGTHAGRAGPELGIQVENSRWHWPANFDHALKLGVGGVGDEQRAIVGSEWWCVRELVLPQLDGSATPKFTSHHADRLWPLAWWLDEFEVASPDLGERQ
jgi:hypothetical protein